MARLTGKIADALRMAQAGEQVAILCDERSIADSARTALLSAMKAQDPQNQPAWRSRHVVQFEGGGGIHVLSARVRYDWIGTQPTRLIGCGDVVEAALDLAERVRAEVGIFVPGDPKE